MADLQTCYYVNFPATGSMRASHRGNTVEVTPGCGALYQPMGPVHMRTSDDYESYALRVDRRVLENELETLLDHPVGRPLDLDLSLDLTRGSGASWSRLVTALTREAVQQDSLFTHRLAGPPLHDALITGLLHAAGHRWRDELDRPAPSWAPRPVHRAVEAMHARPDLPHSPTSLAATAGISVRSLHEAFRSHIGMTPMTYLRQLRLQHAHNELRCSEPTDTTVTDTARRWGFAHLSRFAQAYQRRYGECPSTTLRHAATTRGRRRSMS
jgi:AraC-like DNA-binding protein